MCLTGLSVKEDANSVSLIGMVERSDPQKSFELYFRFPGAYRDFISRSADAFAAAMLIPAMHAGEHLEIVPPVSPGFAFNLTRIRDVFHTWYPDLERIDIVAPAEERGPNPDGKPAASFFSGGVDSLYTLLRYSHADKLPAPLLYTIFMRGIETELERTKGAEDSERHAQDVAAKMGVQCIVGETNLRSHFAMNWEAHYCGSALAATALSLGGGLSHVCVPASYSYRNMAPSGSTALVDEMFSSHSTRILYDGADTPRAEKVARILRWQRSLVLGNLRVCARNFGGSYNCGECYKCVRTAIALHILGVPDDSGVFVNQSMAHWGKVVLTDHLSLIEENLALARRNAADAGLVRLLQQIVRRRASRAALRTFVRNTRLEHLLWLAPKRWLR